MRIVEIIYYVEQRESSTSEVRECVYKKQFMSI